MYNVFFIHTTYIHTYTHMHAYIHTYIHTHTDGPTDTMNTNLKKELTDSRLFRMLQYHSSFIQDQISRQDENLEVSVLVLCQNCWSLFVSSYAEALVITSSFLQFPERQDGEIFLYQSHDVIQWLDWHKHNKMPPVKEFLDYVVMTPDLYTEFDALKEEMSSNVLLPFSNLIVFWMKHENHPLRVVEKYGKKYLGITSDDANEMCMWVRKARILYDEGIEVFR